MPWNLSGGGGIAKEHVKDRWKAGSWVPEKTFKNRQQLPVFDYPEIN